MTTPPPPSTRKRNFDAVPPSPVRRRRLSFRSPCSDDASRPPLRSDTESPTVTMFLPPAPLSLPDICAAAMSVASSGVAPRGAEEDPKANSVSSNETQTTDRVQDNPGQKSVHNLRRALQMLHLTSTTTLSESRGIRKRTPPQDWKKGRDHADDDADDENEQDEHDSNDNDDHAADNNDNSHEVGWTYSSPVRCGDEELRHVIAHGKSLPVLARGGGLLTEAEWRSCGIQMSRGWVHYYTRQNCLMFRRPWAQP